MKKHLVVAAGLAVLSTGAFASKARMTALNQDHLGSSVGSFTSKITVTFSVLLTL